MPSFSITPAGPFPPAAESGFPDFIQWQFNGVNLGEPTVTTVNIVSGAALNVTRGTGENSGILTIVIPAS